MNLSASFLTFGHLGDLYERAGEHQQSVEVDQLGEGDLLPDAIVDFGNRAAAHLGVPPEQIGRPGAGRALHPQRGRTMGQMKSVPGGVNAAGIAQEAGSIECMLEYQHGQQAVHVSVAGGGNSSIVQP